MLQLLKECTLCPHMCKVNRLENKFGRCKCNSSIRIALVSLHHFEEPCISGTNGSGTIFFSGCNLNCMFCQNYKISQTATGKITTINELAEIFLNQQKTGAHNINLVTPTMYVPQIIEALKLAKQQGLEIPIIYNSNGYENLETIRLLNGFVDIYLPDFKYFYDDIAKKYSNINNYFNIASKSILEMYYQVGLPQFDSSGLLQKGLLIRHLVLPNNIDNTKQVLLWIKQNLPKNVYISLMAQYFPTYLAKTDTTINRKLLPEEYNEVKDYFYSLDFVNGYMQELGDHEEEYVPDFDIS